MEVAWQVAKFQDALRRDGAYLLRSNQDGWTAEQFWETYMQLATVERAFRVLKSELLAAADLASVQRPHAGARFRMRVGLCVVEDARPPGQAGRPANADSQTRPARGNAVPKPRPMTPEVILRELSRIMIGDIELPTTDGRRLIFRRVARPNAEQKRILQALGIDMPERLSPDRVL